MKENILQTLENLNVIKENLQNISPIEKDILLQELRNLYVTVLKTEAILDEEEPSDDKIESEVPVEEPEPTPIVEEEPAPEVEETPAETTEEAPVQEETISPDLLDLFEEEAEEAPMLIMPEINENHVEANVEEAPETEVEEPVVEEPAAEPTPEMDLFAEIEDKPVEETTQPEIETVSDDLLQFLPQEEVKPKEEPQPEITEEPETVETPAEEEKPAESAQQERRSLNDLLQSQHDEKSLSDKMQQSKIEDLLKAISLNDKFLFIRELFDGKGEDFSNCIQKLNHCANIDEAFETLEIMKKHYFWESTSAAYLSLCDLIRRRYI